MRKRTDYDIAKDIVADYLADIKGLRDGELIHFAREDHALVGVIEKTIRASRRNGREQERKTWRDEINAGRLLYPKRGGS